MSRDPAPFPANPHRMRSLLGKAWKPGGVRLGNKRSLAKGTWKDLWPKFLPNAPLRATSLPSPEARLLPIANALPFRACTAPGQVGFSLEP